MKLGITTTAAVWTMVFAGCASGTYVPRSSSDVSTECAATCNHIEQLNCLGQYALESCVNMCTRVKRSGYLELPTACALAAKDAMELEACGIHCE